MAIDTTQNFAALHADSFQKLHEDIRGLEQTMGSVRCRYDRERDWSKVEDGTVHTYTWNQVRKDVNASWVRVIEGADARDPAYVIEMLDRNERPKPFIATCAPSKEVINKFIDMVFKENVPTIVKLTNDIEVVNDRWHEKAQTLLPQNPGKAKKMGSYTVTCLRSDPECLLPDSLKIARHDYQIVSDDEEELPKPFTHFHVIDWKDGSAASKDDVLAALQIVQEHHEHPDTPRGPALVHCSSGIGRTGVFIGAWILSRYPALTTESITLSMRAQRYGLGGIFEQFLTIKQIEEERNAQELYT